MARHEGIIRHPENVAGDFYVKDGCCISCGVPNLEAPDIIGWSKGEYSHCVVVKQPSTSDELDRMIGAVSVSCVSCIRYGGTDRAIIERLRAIGEGGQCDVLEGR